MDLPHKCVSLAAALLTGCVTASPAPTPQTTVVANPNPAPVAAPGESLLPCPSSGDAAAPHFQFASVGDAAAPCNGTVSNADKVVKGMRGYFRGCYNHGLASDPNQRGSVRVTGRIGPDGDVVSVHSSGGAGLSAEVVNCVTDVVRRAKFFPPEGGGATIVIPVTFERRY